MISVERLYAHLPQLSCEGCGQCCVSPTCTLVEFIYLMQFARSSLSGDQFRHVITRPPSLHDAYEGNLECPFLLSGRCSIHPGRTGACRLFGIPGLDQLQIEGLVTCRNDIRIIEGSADAATVSAWIDELYTLESRLYTVNVAPYFVRGFNIACWLDIYFDDTLDVDVFADLKHILHAHLDLDDCAGSYRAQTGLKAKVDKISILSLSLQCGDPSVLIPLLTSIRDDYPLTGTYFYEESRAFLRAIDPSPPSG